MYTWMIEWKNIKISYISDQSCVFEHIGDLLSIWERKREKESDLLETYIKM